MQLFCVDYVKIHTSKQKNPTMKTKYTFPIIMAAVLALTASCHKDDDNEAVADDNQQIQTINSKPDDEEPVLLNNREILTQLDGNVSETGSFVIEQAVRAGNWEDGEYYSCSFSYVSTTADGQPVWLTGRMAWPKDGDAKNVVVGCHSIITDDASCPSKNTYPISDCGIASAMFASNSLVVFPDYEGFGSTADRPQVFMRQETTARQVVDGIVAARKELVNRHHGSLNDGHRTVIVGYSQGAAVAMAVQKYLEQGFTGENPKADDIHLAGIVCGDGIYDPLATIKKYVSDNRLYMPVIAPLVVQSICKYHPLMAQARADDFLCADFLNSGIIHWIDDKNLSTSEIQQKLCDYSINHSLGTGEYALAADDPVFTMYGQADLHPDSYMSRTDGYIAMNVVNNDNYDWRTTPGARYAPPTQMIRKETLDFLNGKPAKFDALATFVNAIDENNLTKDWTPAHPMVLFHSLYDEVMPFVNYENAKSAFANTAMFHGIIYNTRMLQKHDDVWKMFFAFYLAKYTYVLLSNRSHTLDTELTVDSIY